MKFEPFLKFLVDLNIFGETEFPFYDISGLCVNVNNAMSADKHACKVAWSPGSLNEVSRARWNTNLPVL